MSLPRAALFALGLLLVSWLSVRAGIYIGDNYAVPIGEGQDLHSGVREDLYRFDAEYYYDIAINGYSYNGDPNSSPNIVFAPLYSLLVDAVSFLGMDQVTAGFALNKILLLVALTALLLFLNGVLPDRRPVWILLAMVTAAGSYSFHAYYSESTMLALLSLCLLFHQRKNWPALAISAALLGAARVTALPIVLLFAAYLTHQAWENRHDKKSAGKLLIYAFLCPLGLAAYLGYIWSEFGNPFVLFPEIQSASWGLFHPPIDWAGLLTGSTLLGHWLAALGKGAATFTDPKTLNLVWTTLALASAVYVLRKYRRELWAWVFVVYFLFIYFTNSTSDYLISSHRFFVLMLPIFVMFSGLNRWLVGLLLLLNLAYGLFHTAYFNNGVWYYF